MLISIILAWLCVIFAILTALKYVTRKSGRKKLNRAFSHSHKIIGVLLIITALIHGIFAGNPVSAKITDMTFAPVLFTFNWGTACFIAAILLALTYVFRKRLKKRWMLLHRILTVIFLCLIVIHVSSVGIHLDNQIKKLFASANNTHQTETTADTTAAEDSQSVPQESSQQTTSQTVIEETNILFSGAQLKDGTYEGTAEGYHGDITVSVTVSGGEVTDITVLSQSESNEYFSRATAVIDLIINSQSLTVDAVSGATFSSKGIVNAAAAALQNAVIAGELETAQ